MSADMLLLPLMLFWTLEIGCLLTLVLLLGVAQALRRWPGGGPLCNVARGLLMGAMSTLIALLLLVAGLQLGQFTAHSFDAPTLFNLELAGLLLASLLHLVCSCLLPLHRLTPPVRPLTSRPPEQERSTHRRPTYR